MNLHLPIVILVAILLFYFAGINGLVAGIAGYIIGKYYSSDDIFGGNDDDTVLDIRGITRKSLLYGDDKKIEELANQIIANEKLDKVKPINILSLFTGVGGTELLLCDKLQKMGYTLGKLVTFDVQKNDEAIHGLDHMFMTPITRTHTPDELERVINDETNKFTFAISINQQFSTGANVGETLLNSKERFINELTYFRNMLQSIGHLPYYAIFCINADKSRCNVERITLNDYVQKLNNDIANKQRELNGLKTHTIPYCKRQMVEKNIHQMCHDVLIPYGVPNDK